MSLKHIHILSVYLQVVSSVTYRVLPEQDVWMSPKSVGALLHPEKTHKGVSPLTGLVYCG